MNRDDDLLEALGQAANDRDAEDDRWWDAVAREDAEGLPSEGAVDALRPLDDAEMDDIATMLAASGAPKADEGSSVVPISSARRWVVPGGALLAAAAAVLLFVSGPDGSRLPRYGLDVRSGEQIVRSGDAPAADVTVYSRGATFDFVLVPDAPADGEVGLTAAVVGADGARPWEAPYERLPGGTLRVRGKVGEQLDLPPGDWRVVFFVGRAAALPTQFAASTPDGVQRFEAKIRVR